MQEQGRPCGLGCGRLTSLTRWPGVLEIAQVHSFLLGYLSGQLGLVMVPLVDVTLWSQPAVGKWGKEISKDPGAPVPREERNKALPSCPPCFFLLFLTCQRMEGLHDFFSVPLPTGREI